MPAMIFTFVWTTLVYCVVANWIWGVGGWAFKWGVLDYAGAFLVALPALFYRLGS